MLFRSIQRADGDLTMLRGSMFGRSTVLVKEDAITRVSKTSSNVIKIKFNNNCAISLKYTFSSDCQNDFRHLGGVERSSFGSSFSRRNTSSRINDVLGNSNF